MGKMDEQLITIIVATFNSEMYLRDCLLSIKRQNYKSFEVVIVDAASTDSTIQIIKEFEKSLPLSYITERDSGIYDAWNKGLKMSRGSWITFVGSDDIMNDNWLQLMVSKINEDPSVNFASGITTVVDYNLKPIRRLGSEWNLSKMKRFMTIAHVGAFHHRQLFDKFGGFNLDYQLVADYEFLLRAGELIQGTFVNNNIGIMRHGGASDSINALLEAFKVHKSYRTINRCEAAYRLLWGIAAYYKRKWLNNK